MQRLVFNGGANPSPYKMPQTNFKIGDQLVRNVKVGAD